MNEKTKKILDIAMKVATWVLIAFTVFMMVFTIVTVSTVDRNDRSIFGVRFYIVRTDSMSKSDKNADLDVHFDAGDIIITKKVKKFSDLKEGDIISFMSTNSDSYGETITHMIREVKREDGKLVGYVTYGTNTGVNDEAIVEPEYVLGVYSGKLPIVGKFFAFLKTTAGYIVCILIPFLLLILHYGVNVIKAFKEYKKEQNRALDEEKAAIEEERRQNAEILLELKALKEEMERRKSENSEPSVNAPSPETADATEKAPEIKEEAKPKAAPAPEAADAEKADTATEA